MMVAAREEARVEALRAAAATAVAGLVEEVWVRDVVWEAMVTTAWVDYITRLNR